jgi:hypothetical protein
MKKIYAFLVLLLALSAGSSYAQFGGLKDQNLSPELYRTVHDGLKVYNGTGSSITAGKLVYVCGWLESSSGSIYQTPKVCLADNEAHAAAYVTRATIANGYIGDVFRTYRATAQNTGTTASVGAPVYLSSTAGGWTLTKPLNGIVQIVGRAAAISATVGVVEFNTESESPVGAGGFLLTDNFPFDLICVQNDGTACSGTDTEVNLLYTGNHVMEESIIGTATKIKPGFTAAGLSINLDAANGEGAEYNWGITARSPGACTIGTDACYFLAKFTITTVAGTDDTAIGFRNDGAYAAAIDDYTDEAVLNVIAGDIKIETIDDNAGTTTTDTTDDWADGETHTLGVYISAAGVVTYTIDGAAPSTTAAHTIDDGDVVVPFIYSIQNATTTAITLLYTEFGRQ